VSKAVFRAAQELGLSNVALALGLSEATISRLGRGAYTLEPGSKPYELALLFLRLYRSLDAMTGGESVPMRAWMRSHNLALAGVPADQVRTVTGLVAAVDYVDSARARI
jgi:hypothetical protein